jgi:rhamnulokinase
MTSAVVAAVDLGATSGRVMLGRVAPHELALEPVARFPNGPETGADGTLHWNLTGLFGEVRRGLERALDAGIASVGIDAWAVDYGLLSEDGALLAEPFHYRDQRNLGGVERVHGILPFEQLYRRNGLQFLTFNTLYQLVAERQLPQAHTALLIPDLLAYWLTGRTVAERTNASTTGLLDVRTREWDNALIERLGLPRYLFPELVDPGEVIGAWRPGVQVTAVGSHDTASAVVAVPAPGRDFAYISCGTWGLVGVELDEPVLTDEAGAANFTNEGGVDGRVRFLHNVMGLWLLNETLAEWGAAAPAQMKEILDAAGEVTAAVGLFDPNDPSFVQPGPMQGRIEQWLRANDQPVPGSRPELVRSILESLADAFATAVADATRLSGTRVSVIHLVGGGSQNELLCALTARRSGLPVLAGPVEATALGNVLVQGRALGAIDGRLEDLRALVARAFPPVRYEP